mgnify:CR=1 FL=1
MPGLSPLRARTNRSFCTELTGTNRPICIKALESAVPPRSDDRRLFSTLTQVRREPVDDSSRLRVAHGDTNRLADTKPNLREHLCSMPAPASRSAGNSASATLPRAGGALGALNEVAATTKQRCGTPSQMASGRCPHWPVECTMSRDLCAFMPSKAITHPKTRLHTPSLRTVRTDLRTQASPCLSVHGDACR